MAIERAAPALLSIVIPTRDRRELVLRALQSVLDQAGGELQVIVVDDGSSDGTRAALRARHGGDARVEVIDCSLRNASAARNVGFAAARGELVCFLDSDDYWLPGMLAVIRAAFLHRPELAFVSVDGGTDAAAGQAALRRVVAGDSPGWSHPRFPRDELARETVELPDGRGATLLRGDFFPAIINGDLFYLSGLVMRRDRVAAAGPFNERFRFFNDWEFFARLCLTGPGAYVDYDGFRRDTGRPDQISRRRPLTSMPRRHLYLLRSLARRPAVAAAYGDRLRLALRDAHYRMAHCLAASGQRRRARLYLFTSIRNRHKPLRCLVRLVGLYLLPRARSRTGW